MKTMFRIVLICIILGSAASTSFAQHRSRGWDSNMEKFKSMKISYLTEKLELTPAEAEKFWPVYNQHEKARNELSQKRRMRSKEMATQTELSDKEAEEFIDQYIRLREQALQMDIEFHNQLKKILGPKKTMQLYMAENQFREEMLKKIRDERGGDGGKGGKH